MFDFSLGEILLIGVVALVVLGPERLPVVARTLGALLARAQRFAASVKSDIQREADRAGFGELQQDVRQTAFALQERLENELHQVSAALEPATRLAVAEPVVAETSAVEPSAVPAGEAPGALDATPEPSAGTAGAELLAEPAAPVAASSTTVLAEPGAPELPPRDENQLDLFEELLPPSRPLPDDVSAQ